MKELLWYNYSPVCGSSTWQFCGRANRDLLQEGLCHTLGLPGLLLPVPRLCGRPLLTRAFIGDPQTLTVRSGSVSCGGHCPFSWVLAHITFCLYLPRVCGGYEAQFQLTVPLLRSRCSFSFFCGRGYLFLVGSNILLLMAVQQLVVGISQEKMSAYTSTLPSWY